MTTITIPEKECEKIAKHYGIADVYFFGSQATGFAHEGSDTDIAVRFLGGLPAPEKRGTVYGELYADLNSYFSGSALDLVFFQEAPLHVQFKIVTEGRLLYTHNLEETADIREHIANLYRDQRYFIEEYMQGLLAAPISSS